MVKNIVKIQIVDSGKNKYLIRQQPFVLGRQYENNATEIQIERPENEKNSTCFLVATNQYGEVLDHIDMTSDKCLITSNLSKHKRIYIGFYFSGENDYLKGSEIVTCDFLPSPKPDGFIPVEPEQKQYLDYLIKNAITKTVDDLVYYYKKTETYTQKEIENLVNKKIAQINATQVRNKEPNLVIEVTSENVQEIATKYIVDNYGRQPQEYDGLYLTFTDHENQVVEYAFHNNAWVSAGFDKVDLSNYVDLITEQRIGGRKVFTGEVAHENHTDFYSGLTANDSAVSVTNTEKDMVTKYLADKISCETGTGEDAQIFYYKFPNKSGTFVTDEQIAYLEYAPVVELSPSTATNGILNEDDYNNLIEHDDIRIKLNNEYYDLMNDESTPGIRSYVHKGWNGTSNQDKSINITLSTKSWTLKVGGTDLFEHTIKVSGNNDDNSESFEFMFLFISKKSTAITTQLELMNLIGSETQLPVSGYRKSAGAFYPIIYIKGGNTYSYINSTTGLAIGGITSLGNYNIVDEVE